MLQAICFAKNSIYAAFGKSVLLLLPAIQIGSKLNISLLSVNMYKYAPNLLTGQYLAPACRYSKTVWQICHVSFCTHTHSYICGKIYK